MSIETYVEPAPRRGWHAVAHIPMSESGWFIPPRHRVWRPSRELAFEAIPEAVERLEHDVAQRKRRLAAKEARESRREMGQTYELPE